MEENKIEMKSLNELLKYGFFIPSYQRGYRWTVQQVEDLLEDVWEFTKKEKNRKEFYCLQPIVVREVNVKTKSEFDLDNSKVWYEVVDGQQRLTTIHILLTFFDNLLQLLQKQKYIIKYETRNDSAEFLNKIELNEEEKNIDYFYINQAFKTITNWFAKNHSVNKIDFLNSILREDDNNCGNNNVRIIWYETNAESVDIFTRINMGKIPLTNAELIKALFLNSSNFNDSDNEKLRLKQFEIASEWDKMEYALQDDSFWLFLNKNKNPLATRIEFIFNLMANKELESDDYFTFRYFVDKYKNKNEQELADSWQDIKKYYQTLEEWFLDRELYHKIGFLVATGTEIKEILSFKKELTKTQFKISLTSEIEKKVKVNLENLEYGSGMTRNILLLHNITTMLNNENETNRFPFDRFKKENWDVEHIHAIATEVKVKKENRKEWVINNYIKPHKCSNENVEKLIDKIKNNEFIIDSQFDEIIRYVLGEEDNNLRNLCLLDRGTNRSYKNDAFVLKRKKIIENELKGTFIPICTKNVFMKYYSKTFKSLDAWNEEDRKSYFRDIYRNTQVAIRLEQIKVNSVKKCTNEQ